MRLFFSMIVVRRYVKTNLDSFYFDSRMIVKTGMSYSDAAGVADYCYGRNRIVTILASY